MYACLCRRVTDRCVRAAIAGGAGDIEAVGRACGAGTGCGGCQVLVEAMLGAAEVGPASSLRRRARWWAA
ncbi:MAG: (2Fe-2S)-binding protein [Acidimicrobiales bacterium]